MWPQIRHMYFFIGRESDWSKLSFYQVHPGDVPRRMHLGSSSDSALEARAAMSSPTDQDPDFPPLVMTFAASDPSGGAGLQADILTLASMGCHPLSVVTAITVQDTLGVEGIQTLDVEWIADQARCLLEDMPVDAFKIGVMGSAEIVAAIAEIVSDYPDVPLVLDPVLASGRGDEFATEETSDAMREFLLPHATIITPNSM